MYMLGQAGDDVNEYNLSTAWDISTGSYSQNFSVAAQDGAPGDIFFKDDGLKMYVVGYVNDNVYEYNLSTAWDISTTLYSQAFSISTQSGVGRALFFKNDGTKMFVGDASNLSVYEYGLSTAWNISTSSYTQNFSVSTQVSANGLHGLYFSPDGTEMFVCDIAGDVYEYLFSTGWDLSTASYSNNTFDSSAQATQPSGISFKTDGSKMYLIGVSTDTIFQYSTVAPVWTDPDLTNASYDSVSFSVGTQALNPHSLVFRPNGERLYVVDDNNNAIYEYDLSTAWDLTTASYNSVSLSVGSQESYPSQIYFKPDGTKFYVIGFAADSVFQYGLTTAWDLSTASYDSVSFSVSSQTTASNGLAFKPDGTKFYVCEFTGSAGKVYEYSLSTPWDLTTASFVNNSGNLTQEGVPAEIVFNPDGTKLFLAGPIQDKVFQYSLSTAWDITTISYDSVSFSVASQENNFRGFTFKTDGSKMYAVGWTNATIYQYSTVVTWTNPNLATASYDSVSFSVGTQDGTPAAMFFKNDGTKVYMAGQGTDTLYEYSLSTAWDMSTASYNSVSLNITTNVANALGLYFRDDGLKMYLSSGNNNTIVEYNLSTAWDITTSSYNQNFSISGQDALAADLYFKDDGTKMYVIGYYGQDVNEYSLSTAWDISSASYNQNFSVATQETTPFALWFSPDGTRMYVAGNAGDDVNEYALSTGWDISTASYVQNFSVASQEITPRAIAFKSNGSKMYVIGTGNDTIYQYST
jgi:DNA-binding beta-propeller fold protein YncE